MSDARRDSGFGIRGSGNTMPVDLEAAIDAVARQMMEAEPSAALRARVLEAIDQGRGRRALAVPRWAWAGAAATVVLALAAVWFARPIPVPETADRTVAAPRVMNPLVMAVTQSQQAEGAPVPLVARLDLTPRGSSSAAPRATRLEAREVTEETSSLPALSVIEPLEFSAVEPDPLQISAVEVSPFPAMPSIDIPSLDPGSNDIQPVDSKKEK